MLKHRLHEVIARFVPASDLTDEHRAAVDLVVLTAYADGWISTDELEEIDSFDAEHAGWDTAGFSVQQYLPIAVAKVRRAIEQPGGTDAVLDTSTARITDAKLRKETVAACNSLASLGGQQTTESSLIAAIERRLG